MKNDLLPMKPIFRTILGSAIGLFSFVNLAADVVTLKNGDVLSGTVLEDGTTAVVLESAILGQIEIPKAEVESVVKDSGETATEETAAAEETPPPPPPEKSLSEHYWETLTRAIFPEDFTGEILIGYDYSESSDIQSGIKLGLKGEYKRGKHTATGDIFYAYTRREDADGTVTKPTDKYGLNASYEYDIREPFFLRGSEKYLVDRVKKIKHQNDLNLLLGWRAIDEETLSLDFAVGPGVRYLETSSSAGEWDPLVTFFQNSFYRLNESVRIDEAITYSVDPSDTGSYSLLFEVSASVRLTAFAEPKIIYRNSYDSTVGEGGVKREQSLLLALAVPF